MKIFEIDLKRGIKTQVLTEDDNKVIKVIQTNDGVSTVQFGDIIIDFGDVEAINSRSKSIPSKFIGKIILENNLTLDEFKEEQPEYFL